MSASEPPWVCICLLQRIIIQSTSDDTPKEMCFRLSSTRSRDHPFPVLLSVLLFLRLPRSHRFSFIFFSTFIDRRPYASATNRYSILQPSLCWRHDLKAPISSRCRLPHDGPRRVPSPSSMFLIVGLFCLASGRRSDIVYCVSYDTAIYARNDKRLYDLLRPSKESLPASSVSKYTTITDDAISEIPSLTLLYYNTNLHA